MKYYSIPNIMMLVIFCRKQVNDVQVRGIWFLILSEKVTACFNTIAKSTGVKVSRCKSAHLCKWPQGALKIIHSHSGDLGISSRQQWPSKHGHSFCASRSLRLLEKWWKGTVDMNHFWCPLHTFSPRYAYFMLFQHFYRGGRSKSANFFCNLLI